MTDVTSVDHTASQVVGELPQNVGVSRWTMTNAVDQKTRITVADPVAVRGHFDQTVTTEDDIVADRARPACTTLNHPATMSRRARLGIVPGDMPRRGLT